MRTIPLSEYIQKRAAAEPGFREALVNEALDEMLAGERDAAVALLEDVAKARARGKAEAARKIRRPRRRAAAKELVEA